MASPLLIPAKSLSSLYRRLHILERKVSFRPAAETKHEPSFLYKYIQHSFTSPYKGTKDPKKRLELANEFLAYRECIDQYTDLLIRYRLINPMDDREYIKRQAAHVGLALPTFNDEKPDTSEFEVPINPPLHQFKPLEQTKGRKKSNL